MRKSLIAVLILATAGAVGTGVFLWRAHTRTLDTSHPSFRTAASVTDLYSVLMVAGPVEVRTKRETLWRRVTLATPLYAGENIRTGPRAFVDLLLGKGNYMRIGENTELELRAAETEGKSQYWIDLILGSIGIVARDLEGTELAVTTTTAVIGVRGTSFMVNALEGGQTLLSVLEGMVQIASKSAPDRPQRVGPLQQATVDAKTPPRVEQAPETALEQMAVLERIKYFPEKPGPKTALQKARSADSRLRTSPSQQRDDRLGPSRSRQESRLSAFERRRQDALRDRRKRSPDMRERIRAAIEEARAEKPDAGRSSTKRDAGKAAPGRDARPGRPSTKAGPAQQPDAPSEAPEESSEQGEPPDEAAGTDEAPTTEAAEPSETSEEQAPDRSETEEPAADNQQTTNRSDEPPPFDSDLADRTTILTWIESCRVEIQSLVSGQCTSSAGSGFTLQGVNSEFLPDQSALSIGEIKNLLGRAQDNLTGIRLSTSGQNININGAAAFVTFNVSAEATRASSSEKITQTWSVMMRMEKTLRGWRPLWARLL